MASWVSWPRNKVYRAMEVAVMAWNRVIWTKYCLMPYMHPSGVISEGRI